MICAVISGPSYQKVKEQIEQAIPYSQIVELRLDLFESIDFKKLKEIQKKFNIPLIFTLRSSLQGGGYQDSEENRLGELLNLANLNPQYIDLEYPLSMGLVKKIQTWFPHIQLIISYHHFFDTPTNQELDQLYLKMQFYQANYYKIAVTPQCNGDLWRFLSWKKKSDHCLIAISMGSLGQPSRILSPIIGNPITYAAPGEKEEQSFPGQLSAKCLFERYRHLFIHSDTPIYGLIGDPVTLSISDETHNHLFSALDLNGLYIKLQVKEEEIAAFLAFAKILPFRGLSVTMPLKEKIVPYVDQLELHSAKIGAVNTLLFENDQIFGFNTDGIGALNAIESQAYHPLVKNSHFDSARQSQIEALHSERGSPSQIGKGDDEDQFGKAAASQNRHFQLEGGISVQNKHIVLIGAGGSARAIAYEASLRGARVTIVNRHPQKAHDLADELHCRGKALENFSQISHEGYDILINSTAILNPLSEDFILSEVIAMDVHTVPKNTPFLLAALERKCQIIYGYQMFVNQALEQFCLWFKGLDREAAKTILEASAKTCI